MTGSEVDTVDEWQPIETAPRYKELVEVLVFYQNYYPGESRVVIQLSGPGCPKMVCRHCRKITMS